MGKTEDRTLACELTPGLLTWADDRCPSYPVQYPPVAAWLPVGGGELRQAWARALASGVPAGLYAHLPFCRAVCRYCGVLYRKGLTAPAEVETYLEAIGLEADWYAPIFSGTACQSLFLGGGTPTLLEGSQMERLVAAMRLRFRFAPGARFGMEGNPESLDGEKAVLLRDLGVDYFSLGVQSLDDAVLAHARRPHTAAQARAAFGQLHALTGICVNVDLIAGLEGQTCQSFLSDVREVGDWGPDTVHLSCFRPSWAVPWVRSGRRYPPERIESWGRWVEEGFQLLVRAGYRRVSGFYAGRGPVRPPWQASHAFFGRASVLGLGAGAFSSGFRTLRSQNVWPPAAYAAAVKRNGLPVERGCFPSERAERTHLVLAAFASRSRVDRREFEAEFGDSLLRCFGEELQELVSLGVLERREEGYALRSHPGAEFQLARAFYEKEVVRRLADAASRAHA